MKGIIVLGLLIICTGSVSAQYFQFSQYNFTPQRISPTAPASSDYARLSFLYRNQGAAGDVHLNSNMLSASYPLLTPKGKRWSGIGVTLLDDRSGGIYSISEGAISYAVNIFLTDLQTLSLGFKGLYQQRKVDLSGLFTESQFIPDRGFDPSAFNGETMGTFRSDYITLSSGLSWQQLDKNGVNIAYWSFSIFDFNRPEDSFLGNENKLNSTLVGAAGFRLYKNHNMSMFPEILYTRGSSNNVVNVGLITRCDVPGTRTQKPFYVDVISKYVVGRSGIFGLQFHNENFAVGMSYDFPVHKTNVSNMGAFEIGIELKKLVERSVRNKSAKKQAPTKTSTQKTTAKTPVKKATVKTQVDSVKQKQPVTKKPTTPKKTLSETLQSKQDSVVANVKAGNLHHEPFVLEKVILHFNFQFNSSDLDDESSKYLDDLATALRDNPHLRVKLTGHTDNIGNAKFNHRLSLHRANAIKEYLVTKGVDAGRVDTDGKGMSEPLNNNQTEEDRAKNRRVELTILYEE